MKLTVRPWGSTTEEKTVEILPDEFDTVKVGIAYGGQEMFVNLYREEALTLATAIVELTKRK